MTYHLRITAAARAKIEQQAAFIAIEEQAPVEAARWLERVRKVAHSLKEMPLRREAAPEDKYCSYSVHWIRHGHFALLYTLVEETQTVWVINARSTRQLERPGELPGSLELLEEEAPDDSTRPDGGG